MAQFYTNTHKKRKKYIHTSTVCMYVYIAIIFKYPISTKVHDQLRDSLYFLHL